MDQFVHDVYETFVRFWPHIFAAVVDSSRQLATSAHAVLHKRDTRATIGWVGLIWLSPLIGVVLYFMFGVNRIKRRGTLLAQRANAGRATARRRTSARRSSSNRLSRPQNPHMETLVELVGRLTNRPLLCGNTIEPLDGGDVAYPAMIAAIDGAKRSIALMTYIFDNDRVGKMFVEALQRAVQRGVEVRVLIDAIGARYTFPSIVGALAKAGVRVERFLRTFVPGYFAYSNLRNHRKILDRRRPNRLHRRHEHPRGRISETQSAASDAGPCTFALTGPVVLQLQEVFAEDWAFSTNEILQGDLWYPPLEPTGEMLARGIRYGPDEDLGEIQLALAGALSCANSRVAIVTPYFLPDDAIISALDVAAMRGVAGRYHPAGEEQSHHRAMGLHRHALAGARAGLPRLALAAAVRPLEADARRWPVEPDSARATGTRGACG